MSLHTPFTPEQKGRAIHDWLLADRIAMECARRGYRRIALYATRDQARPILRQPWRRHGVDLVAVLEEGSSIGQSMSGVPITAPDLLDQPVDAVVIALDERNVDALNKARDIFSPQEIPVLRIHDADAWSLNPDPTEARNRLIELHGIDPGTADWLIANRFERHDANLPMLAPSRTEYHLRRYDFAGMHVQGKCVLDCACGLGYGSAQLAGAGAAQVRGIDIDERTIAYANDRCAVRDRVSFKTGNLEDLDVDEGPFDTIVSFETIEHLDDPDAGLKALLRVLKPDGLLIMSTPNDWGRTQFHKQNFTVKDFRTLVDRYFDDAMYFGQWAVDVPSVAPYPPGIVPLEPQYEPETIIVRARYSP